MAEVSVMRFNMCAVNLFHSLKMCKMIAQETVPEKLVHLRGQKVTKPLIYFIGFKGAKVFF